MTAYQPIGAYIVAWDWLLLALYVLIAVCIGLGILAVVIVELTNTRPSNALGETANQKE